MFKPVLRVIGAMVLCVLFAAAFAPYAGAAERDRYIVVFEDSVQDSPGLARAQAEQQDGKLGFVYRHALKGYSAELSAAAVEGLRRNPRVKYIVVDGVVSPLEEFLETIDHEEFELFEPTVPTGVQRTFAAANKALDIDGVDDLRVNADVAVIDTGTDHTHADLNVVGRTDCSNGTEIGAKCVNGSGTDTNSHGTHVAGTIGAIDNGVGVVGVAPGARIWGIKVLGTGTNYMSEIIAGVDWVTATRKDAEPNNDIEVANMSLGCSAFSPLCPPKPLDEAITKSVEAGVVHVVAAGNNTSDAKNFTPANSPDAVTVSALADYDGKAEGKGSSTCASFGLDDRLASFSNFGATVELAAPGVCILSTVPGGYGKKSGTSMASPHVAGAAALLAAQEPPKTKAGVEALVETLEKKGNFNWTDTSGDGIKEPLLDLSDEVTFKVAKPSPPENTALPVPSPATPLQAVPETTTTGTWTGSPTSYAYQWQRCNAVGSECVNIVGATKSSYTPVAADVEKTLVVKVTATNANGSTSAFSKPTGKVVPIGQITEYSTKSGAYYLATGPDGNVWNTASGSRINKITPSGTITEYLAPSGEGQFAHITAGPDGNMWFTEFRGHTGTSPAHIVKISMSGVMTYYALPNGSQPTGITAGPDGNIWFTAKRSHKIGKITTAGAITEYTLPAGTEPESIITGPDGNLWFTEPCGALFGCKGKIGKITTAGAITEYTLPAVSQAGPVGIAVGPDNNIWFTEYVANKIGKMSTGGVLLAEYSLPAASNPLDIKKGPDGNLWFTNTESSKIGRITTSGVVTEYALPAKSKPRGITVGPDLWVWFAGSWSNKVGKIAP